jgi:hypothetical protein
MYHVTYEVFLLFIRTNIRWSPVVRAEVLKKPDGKLPCQSLIIAIGPAASGNTALPPIKSGPLLH